MEHDKLYSYDFNSCLYLLNRIRNILSILVDKYEEKKLGIFEILFYKDYREFFYEYCNNYNSRILNYTEDEFDLLLELVEEIENNIDQIRNKHKVEILNIDISTLNEIINFDDSSNVNCENSEQLKNLSANVFNYLKKEIIKEDQILIKNNLKFMNNLTENLSISPKNYINFVPDQTINMLLTSKHKEFLFSKEILDSYTKEKSFDNKNEFAKLTEYLDVCKDKLLKLLENNEEQLVTLKQKELGNIDKKVINTTNEEYKINSIIENESSLVNTKATTDNEKIIINKDLIKIDDVSLINNSNKETKNHIFVIDKNKEKLLDKKLNKNNSSFMLEKKFEEEINDEIFNYTKGMKKIATALSDNIQKGNKTLEVINKYQDEAIKNTNKEIKNLDAFGTNDKITFWTQLKFLVSSIVIFVLTVILKFSIPKFI